jgi:hypothetical protein
MVINGNTIVPLRLISITNESHQVEGVNPLYALLYNDMVLATGMFGWGAKVTIRLKTAGAGFYK